MTLRCQFLTYFKKKTLYKLNNIFNEKKNRAHFFSNIRQCSTVDTLNYACIFPVSLICRFNITKNTEICHLKFTNLGMGV